MEVQRNCDEHGFARRKPFQYSLRTMLILTTAVAVAFSLLVAGPVWLGMLTLVILAIAIPMVLTIVLIYARGPVRTFCVGALFPAGAMLVTLVSDIVYPVGMRAFTGADTDDRLNAAVFMVVGCVVTAAFGLLAVWVRRMVEARAGQQREGSARQVEPLIDMQEHPASTETKPD